MDVELLLGCRVVGSVPRVSSVAEGRILESRLEAIMLRGLHYAQTVGGARGCGSLGYIAIVGLVVLRPEYQGQLHEQERLQVSAVPA